MAKLINLQLKNLNLFMFILFRLHQTNLLLFQVSSTNQSSMNYHNIKENIAPVEMFSKIGRYISHKIVRIPRNKSSNKLSNYSEFSSKKLNKSFSNKNIESKVRGIKDQVNQPPVGHYKIKYTLIDKHLPNVDLKKSLPHFSRQKYYCYQNKTVLKDFPQPIQGNILGFKQLKRMTSREDIKGYIRKVGQNPHEKRFQNSWDQQYWIDSKNKHTINFEKMLKRNNTLFKSIEFSPDYNINMQLSKKKLATHVIKFQNQLSRTNQFFIDKTCLSEQFQQGNTNQIKNNIVNFEKLLPRYNQNQLPSYLDKGINNRMTMGTINWKSLKMNCSTTEKID